MTNAQMAVLIAAIGLAAAAIIFVPRILADQQKAREESIDCVLYRLSESTALKLYGIDKKYSKRVSEAFDDADKLRADGGCTKVR